MPRQRKSLTLLQAMRHASRGVGDAFRREPNVRRQVAILVVVLLAAVIIDVSRFELAVLGIAGGIVLALELMNSALEAVLDIVHPGQSAAVGRAKDVAAGAVLVASMVAAVVGTIIFWSALAGS